MECNEVSLNQEPKKDRSTECPDKKEVEPGSMKEGIVRFKMTFEGVVAKKLLAVSQELKKRGAQQSVLSQFIGGEILNKPDHLWEKWLDEVTPGHFYLTTIQKDPALQSKLEKMLRQMYLGRTKTSVPKIPSKKVSGDSPTPENSSD